MIIPNHGGDIYNYDKDLIDFSSNINPLGYPKGLGEKIYSRMEEVLAYPDVEYRSLRDNIGKYLQVNPENIQVGNGAVEILDQVIAQFKRIILVDPSFSEYRLRAEVHGLEIVSVDLDTKLRLDLEKLKSNIQEGDLVLLANPNNPTGYTLTKDELVELYLYIVEKNAYLLLDEAFFEFADIDYDSTQIFKRLGYSNVGIVRAATKFFGLPGIRLGYGVFDQEMLGLLKKIQLPWTVNSFAVIGSDYIFDEDFVKNSRAYLFKERGRYLKELETIRGVNPYISNSNYVLVKLDGVSEDYVFESMLDLGILIRRCSNYRNLHGTHIRLAIKSTEDNDKLLACLKKIMEV